MINKYRKVLISFFVGMIVGILYAGLLIRPNDYTIGFHDGELWAMNLSCRAVDNIAPSDKTHLLKHRFIEGVYQIAKHELKLKGVK